jgi:hypothetical protein
MLEIVNKTGQVLELDSNTAVPYEKFNTLFNAQGVLREDVSYPGTAPFSPSNKLFFKHAHTIDAQSNLYEFEVIVYLNQQLLMAGKLAFRVTEKSFDFTLKPNFAAFAKIAAKFTFAAVKFNDVTFLPVDKTIVEYMKDTVENPQNYNAIFIPIKNDTQFAGQTLTNSYPFINNFTANNFTPFAPADVSPFNYYVSPLFKVTYILRKCLEFLGFKASGSVFTDAEMIKKHIYSKTSHLNFYATTPTDPRTPSVPVPGRPVRPSAGTQTGAAGSIVTFNSNVYMPNMTIAEFIEKVATRYSLIISFDYATKTATADTFSFVKNQSHVNDISGYVGAVTEIDITPDKGYTVALEADKGDQLFSVTIGDQATTLPTNYLKIGNGETEKTYNVGTLKQSADNIFQTKKYVQTKQSLLDIFDFKPNLIPTSTARPTDSFDNFVIPTQTAIDDAQAQDDLLKVINFNGYSTYKTDSFWPKSASDELNALDADFLNFLNAAKSVKAIATLPVNLFKNIKINQRLAFFSDKGSYHIFLIERIATDLQSKKYIKVEYHLKSIGYYANQFELVKPLPDDSIASFNITISGKFAGGSQITIEVWIITFSADPDYKFTEGVLLQSSDQYGVNGTILNFAVPQGIVPSGRAFEIRCYNRTILKATGKLGNSFTPVVYGGFSSFTLRSNENLYLEF